MTVEAAIWMFVAYCVLRAIEAGVKSIFAPDYEWDISRIRDRLSVDEEVLYALLRYLKVRSVEDKHPPKFNIVPMKKGDK